MKSKIKGARNTTVNKTSARNKSISSSKTGSTVRRAKAGSKQKMSAKYFKPEEQPQNKITSLADLATTPEAKANVNALDTFLVENSKYIKSFEFQNVGKRIEILSFEIDRSPSIFNNNTNNNKWSNQSPEQQQQQQQQNRPRLVVTCRDLDDKNHRERIWTTGITAAQAIKPLYDSNIRIMRIWYRDVNGYPKYYADKTDLSKTKEQEAIEYEKSHGISNRFVTIPTVNNDNGTGLIAKDETAAVVVAAAAAAENAIKLKEYKKDYAATGKVKKKNRIKKKLRKGKSKNKK